MRPCKIVFFFAIPTSISAMSALVSKGGLGRLDEAVAAGAGLTGIDEAVAAGAGLLLKSAFFWRCRP